MIPFEVIELRSRTSGPVGALDDGQGLVVGAAVDTMSGAGLDLAGLAAFAGDDPCRPSSLELRVVIEWAAGGTDLPAGCAAHVLLRIEPLVIPAVVAARGGGVAGAGRAAVAVLDRIVRLLRRSGPAARALDPRALAALAAPPPVPVGASVRLGPCTVSDAADVVGAACRLPVEHAVLAVRVSPDGRSVSLPASVQIALSDGDPARVADARAQLEVRGAVDVGPEHVAALGGAPVDLRTALVRAGRSPRRGPPRRRAHRPGRCLPGRGCLAVVPPAGVPLGVDAAGDRVRRTLFTARRGTTMAVVGEPALAREVALTLSRHARHVTVVTSSPASWGGVARAAAGVVAVRGEVHGWPPAGLPRPWALLLDLPEPPPAGFADAPWGLVVHASRHASDSGHWTHGADVTVCGRGSGGLPLVRDGPLPETVAGSGV